MEARCAFRLDACLERASLKLNTGRLLSRKQVHADTVDVVRVESCIGLSASIYASGSTTK